MKRLKEMTFGEIFGDMRLWIGFALGAIVFGGGTGAILGGASLMAIVAPILGVLLFGWVLVHVFDIF